MDLFSCEDEERETQADKHRSQVTTYRPVKSVCASTSEENSQKTAEEVTSGVMVLESSISKNSGGCSNSSSQNSNSQQLRRQIMQERGLKTDCETLYRQIGSTRVTNVSKVGTLSQMQGTFSEATADTISSRNEQNFASPQTAKEKVQIDNAAYKSFYKSIYD